MLKFRKTAEEAPCKQACPAGIDIPRYIRAIRDGNYDYALAVIRERIPLPSVCGRVCFRPCEGVCNARVMGGPVAINALKRFVTEQGIFEETGVAEASGKRVAVIGSGPAGLTSGYNLSKLGHHVTIFEEMSEPGGMLRMGIPAHRLPRDILDREIDQIKAVGVEIQTDSRVDSLDEIFEKGYDAVFVGTGAPRSMRLGCAGEDSPGVKDGLSFLKDVNMGRPVELGEKVAIIGGGNVAIDSARVARRLGCEDVSILYRRSRTEMPAHNEEINEALEEGVKIIYLIIPDKISADGEGLKLECLRMELCEPDQSGRACPAPIKGSELSMEFDNIIVAIGQVVEIPEQFDLVCDEDGSTLKVGPGLETSRKGVFSGGDVVSGPDMVITAIAMGRRGAQDIDRYLGGDGKLEKRLDPQEPELTPLTPGLPVEIRTEVPKLAVAQRFDDFGEVESTYREPSAIEEATRCLRCDLPMEVDGANCAVCLVCQMICAYKFTGNSFNVFDAAIKLKRTAQGTCEVEFTDKCDNCGLCARYCSYEALSRDVV